MRFPILTSLVFLPVAGAILLLFVRGDEEQSAPIVRKIALIVSLLVFGETLLLWSRFNAASADFQFVERHAWIPAFGIDYHIGVDGISLLLLVLTGFLTPLAFVIKVPLFPFHTWLPDAHVEAPTAGSVILAGVLLKMGTYGLVRFAFPLFPDAALFFAPSLAVLAIVGIIYGALVAMVQPDLKKLVAYSSVSHLGFVVLGIAAMNMQGVQGAVYQMLNHGVSTGGLFLIVGMLSDRRHTRLIAEFGGLKRVMPHLVAAFLIVTLSSIGLPGLNGFVGEFLILLGVFRWDPRMAACAATGVILSATYMLWMFQRVNYGSVTHDENKGLRDLTRREWAVLVPIVAVAVLMGVLPNLFLRPIEPSVARVLHQVQSAAPILARGHSELGIRNSASIPNSKFRIPN